MQLSPRPLGILLFSLVWGSCLWGANTSDDNPILPNPFAPCSGGGEDVIAVALDSPDTVRMNEIVGFTLTITNVSGRTLEYEQAEDHFAFDIVVSYPWGADIWNRLHGDGISSAALPIRLEDREQRTFHHDWDMLTNRGGLVFTGDYCVHGVYFYGDSFAVSERKRLTVVL